MFLVDVEDFVPTLVRLQVLQIVSMRARSLEHLGRVCPDSVKCLGNAMHILVPTLQERAASKVTCCDPRIHVGHLRTIVRNGW